LTRLGRGHGRAGGPQLVETVLEDNDSANKIAVVEVEGIISSYAQQGGFTMVQTIRAQLQRAADDEKVKAVVLKVNSPGGEVMASDDIYRALAKFQKDSDKPVITSMGSLAASGGYYVSAPSRWIMANELTITGSIGVIMNSFNYRGLMDKVGLRPEVYKSGKFKDMLSGSREPDSITPEERQMIQALIDEVFGKFKSIVAEGREQANAKNKAAKSKDDQGRSLASDWAKYADGRVLSGSEALKLGFVDELGDYDAAVKRAKHIAGIRNANLIQYRQRVDLADLFGLVGSADAKVVKIDLGFDAPKLQAGQLYFLSPTVLH
jgi:protease-4